MHIDDIIRRRRSIYPKSYDTDKPIDRATLEQLLENANWAPTHKLTQPWRFQVFHTAESREALAGYLSGYYQQHTPADLFSEEAMQKAGDNARRAGAVIAIVLHRDPEARVPEFEEIAAVSMAVQNMWLTCTEMGLGCYWGSSKATLESGAWLGLEPNERCLGMFYMGWHNLPDMPGKRGDIAEKTVWR